MRTVTGSGVRGTAVACPLSGYSGWWYGTVHYGCVSGGDGDGQAEQVGEHPEITAGGDGLVEDPVEADLLAGHAELVVCAALGHRSGVCRTADVDEQVRVDGGGCTSAQLHHRDHELRGVPSTDAAIPAGAA